MNTLSLSLSLCLSPLSLSGFAHSHQQQQLHQQQQQQLQQQQQQHMSTVPSGTPTSNNGSTQMDLYPPPHITIKGESPTMMVMDTTQGSDSVRIWGTGRVLRGERSIEREERRDRGVWKRGRCMERREVYGEERRGEGSVERRGDCGEEERVPQ